MARHGRSYLSLFSLSSIIFFRYCIASLHEIDPVSTNSVRVHNRPEVSRASAFGSRKTGLSENRFQSSLGEASMKLRFNFSAQCPGIRKPLGNTLHPAWTSSIEALEDTWRTPSQPSNACKISRLSCKGLAPAAGPGSVAPNYSKPITTVDGLLAAANKGQKFLIITPRFGLGNTLRAFLSAWVYAFLTNRRIVLLHAGAHRGIFASFCQAFLCGLDHVSFSSSKGGSSPINDSSLWKEFKLRVPHVTVEKRGLGRNSQQLWLKDKILFTHNHVIRDDFYKGSPDILRCLTASCGCKSVECVWSHAILALAGDGPSSVMESAISDVLWIQKQTVNRQWTDSNPTVKNPLSLRFDVAVHLRTKTENIDCPETNIFCKLRADHAAKKIVAELHNKNMWCCVGTVLSKLALKRRLSIFLAVDDNVVRPSLVKILAAFGDVYYNGGTAAHISVPKMKDQGRLSTLADFYLLSKSGLNLVLGQSTGSLSQVSTILGNGNAAFIHSEQKNCWSSNL